jgi:hypothetical protein
MAASSPAMKARQIAVNFAKLPELLQKSQCRKAGALNDFSPKW